MAATPKAGSDLSNSARWYRDCAAKIAAALPPPRTEAEQMAELAHKLAPRLEPLLGPSRAGMTQSLIVGGAHNGRSGSESRAGAAFPGGARPISWLSANEYIAAAATFIAGLFVGLLLRM